MADNTDVQQSVDCRFTIRRTFDASRALVWRAWTEADRLVEWWGPKSWIIGACRLDVRPGGTFHYSMKTPEGKLLWARLDYREIVAPERIVFTTAFADAAGNVVRAPWSTDWPLEWLNTVTLVEQAGKTTLTLESVPLTAIDIERKAFAAEHESMRHGYTETFDQLADYLARI